MLHMVHEYNLLDLYYNLSLKTKEQEQNDSPFFSLSPDTLLQIAQYFKYKEISCFSQLCQKSLRISQEGQLPSIPLIKLLASKITNIPNRCFDGVKDINVYSQFSVKINGMNDIVISNDNPLSNNQHLSLDRVDFKFTRKLTNDFNTTCDPWDKMVYGVINANFDLESVELTDVNPKVLRGIQKSIIKALSLVKTT